MRTSGPVIESPKRFPRPPAALRGLVLLAGLAGGLSCSNPQVEGGVMPHPPDGFAHDPNGTAARLVLPERAMVRQRGYFTRGDPHSSIMITRYTGATGAAEAAAARDRHAGRYRSEEYGGVETIEIDGRTAWGWTITQGYQGKVYSFEYTAVVPYQDETYTVEFFTSDGKLMNWNFLRETVQTFTVARAGIDPVQMAAGIGVAALLLLAFKRLRRAEGTKPAPAPRTPELRSSRWTAPR